MELRDLLSGAMIRAIAGIRDVGEVIASSVENILGGPISDIDADRKDVLVHTKATISGFPGLWKLYVPQNMLFRLPKQSDSCMVARGQDADAGYVFVGDASFVPTWLDETRSGISIPEVLRLESTGANVEVRSPSIVNLQNGSNGVARVGDAVSVTIPTATVIPGVGTTTGPLVINGTVTAGSTKVRAG